MIFKIIFKYIPAHLLSAFFDFNVFVLDYKNIKIYNIHPSYKHLVINLLPFAQRNLETESGWILGVILFNFAPFIPNKTPEHLLSLEFIQCVFHTLCFTKMGVVNSICFWGPSQKVTDIDINSGHFTVRLRFVCGSFAVRLRSFALVCVGLRWFVLTNYM